MSIVTATGFLLALARLQEIAPRVTSLDNFLQHATDILSHAGSQKSEIRVICHSPLIGNLSDRSKPKQLAFRRAIEHAVQSSDHRVEIIGLAPRALLEYYKRFYDDKRYNPSDVVAAFNELHSFFMLQTIPAMNNTYHALQSSDQPSFFLVASREAAAVGVALYLPRRTSTEGETAEPAGPKVDFIGFMTRSSADVTALFQQFDDYAKTARPISLSEVSPWPTIDTAPAP